MTDRRLTAMDRDAAGAALIEESHALWIALGKTLRALFEYRQASRSNAIRPAPPPIEPR